jgi:hypothetical protein
MTSNKNTQNEEEVQPISAEAPQEVVEKIAEMNIRQPEKLEQCEWVFQFDDDEPQIFAWTSENPIDEDPTVTFTVGNTKDAYISFTNKESGKRFKLFARELTEAGLALRYHQNNLANESTNKEA